MQDVEGLAAQMEGKSLACEVRFFSSRCLLLPVCGVCYHLGGGEGGGGGEGDSRWDKKGKVPSKEVAEELRACGRR